MSLNWQCMTIAKEQLIYAKQCSQQMTNNSQIKCRGCGRALLAIYMKGNVYISCSLILNFMKLGV